MGKPVTLLERLCGHVHSIGAESITVEYKDRREWVLANVDGVGFDTAVAPSFTPKQGQYLAKNI
jgi:hypothetical protein